MDFQSIFPVMLQCKILIDSSHIHKILYTTTVQPQYPTTTHQEFSISLPITIKHQTLISEDTHMPSLSIHLLYDPGIPLNSLEYQGYTIRSKLVGIPKTMKAWENLPKTCRVLILLQTYQVWQAFQPRDKIQNPNLHGTQVRLNNPDKTLTLVSKFPITTLNYRINKLIKFIHLQILVSLRSKVLHQGKGNHLLFIKIRFLPYMTRIMEGQDTIPCLKIMDHNKDIQVAPSFS